MKRLLTISFFLFLLYEFFISNNLTADVIVENTYLEILPNGRTTGSLLENWLNDVVFFQVETGGLSRIDLPRFSPNGISWIEQNYRVNGTDVTDPFISGYPLFEPAWETIDRIRLSYLGENDPYKTGIDWDIKKPAGIHPFNLSYNAIFPFFDNTLIPKGTMDREPSFHYGSPNETRRYKLSNEAGGSFNITDKIYAGIEAIAAEREFPTLTDRKGNSLTEKSEKITLTTSYSNDSLRAPFTVILISQYNKNNNFGANLRLDKENTFTEYNFVNHLQFKGKMKTDDGSLSISSGITHKNEKLDPHLNGPRATELISDSGPVPDAGKISRLNFDNNLGYHYEFLNIEAGLQVNAVKYKPDIPFSQTMNSLDGSIYSVTVWERPRVCDEFTVNTKLKTGAEKALGNFYLSGNIFIDNVYAGANGGKLLDWFGIGGNISTKYSFEKYGTGITAGVLHQPAKLNSSIVGFLNSNRPSGRTYGSWTDTNANGIADESELASSTLVSTTGGKYHYKDDNLKRPYHDEFSLAAEQPLRKNFRIITTISCRVFSDYFIVNYKRYDGTYSSTPQGYSIYNKPAGADEYFLANNNKRTYYSGAGIQLLWESERVYFNLMFKAYMVKGYAPSGNGPDFNDYAVISEDTASPNNRINSNGGRLSSDRAYKANILFAYKIRKDISFGLTLKYRDGEPFSQYRIYYDSNGIPVKVMNQKRGDWYNQGIGRYTFSWNMDIRLRYTPVLFDKNTGITLDIYNVLGSSTEILESSDIQDERLALEAVPQRMIKLGADMKF